MRDVYQGLASVSDITMQTDRQTESMDTIDFPVGSLKPVTYLCKEIPRSCSQPKKASTKVLKLPTSVENITDILTSLPGNS